MLNSFNFNKIKIKLILYFLVSITVITIVVFLFSIYYTVIFVNFEKIAYYKSLLLEKSSQFDSIISKYKENSLILKHILSSIENFEKLNREFLLNNFIQINQENINNIIIKDAKDRLIFKLYPEKENLYNQNNDFSIFNNNEKIEVITKHYFTNVNNNHYNLIIFYELDIQKIVGEFYFNNNVNMNIFKIEKKIENIYSTDFSFRTKIIDTNKDISKNDTAMITEKDFYILLKRTVINGYYISIAIKKDYLFSNIKYQILILVAILISIMLISIYIFIRLLKPIQNILELHFENFDNLIIEKNKRMNFIYKDLLNEKEKNERILDIVGVGIIIVETNGYITLTNKKFCEIVKYKENEVIGLNFFESVVPEESKAVYLNTFNKIISNNHLTEYHFEDYLINKTGEKRLINWSCVQYRDSNQIIIGAIFSCEDITEKKLLEEEYRQSQKMESIGRLAGGIAHDFNNLLTIILGNIEILMAEIEKDNPIYKDIENIKEASLRATSLTNQLLAFSRKQILNPQEININESIISVTKMLKRLIGENIRIINKLDDSLYKVRADKSQIEQILLNLALNSRDAMPNGGEITIQTRNVHIDINYCKNKSFARPGQFVCISFSDTGTGIPESIQKNIFEPFFTTKEIGKGTGLGLSVVYGIIRQHDGWITLHSEVNKGTTFYIYLPAIWNETKNQNSNTDNIDLLNGQNENILFVEDDEEVQKVIKNILSKKNYNVSSFSTFEEAKLYLQNNFNTIDILFTDVKLPDGNGFELVEIANKLNKNIKSIIASGYNNENFTITDDKQNSIIYISKPYSITELLKIINNMLTNK